MTGPGATAATADNVRNTVLPTSRSGREPRNVPRVSSRARRSAPAPRRSPRRRRRPADRDSLRAPHGRSQPAKEERDGEGTRTGTGAELWTDQQGARGGPPRGREGRRRGRGPEAWWKGS